MSIWWGDVIIEYDYTRANQADIANNIIDRLQSHSALIFPGVQFSYNDVCERKQKYRHFVELLVSNMHYIFFHTINKDYKDRLEFEPFYYKIIEVITDFIASVVNSHYDNGSRQLCRKIVDMCIYDVFEKALNDRAIEIIAEHDIKVTSTDKLNFFLKYPNFKAAAVAGMVARLVAGQALNIANEQDIKRYIKSKRNRFKWKRLVSLAEYFYPEIKDSANTSSLWQFGRDVSSKLSVVAYLIDIVENS